MRERESRPYARAHALQLTAAALFLVVFLAGRLQLAGNMVDQQVEPVALLSEALFALGVLGVSELLRRVHWILMPLLLLIVSLLYLANLEMVFAMQTVVNLRELGWRVDRTFFEGSGAALSFPGYGLLLILSTLLFSLSRGREQLVRLRYNLPLALLPFLLLLLLRALTLSISAGEPWQTSSLLWTMGEASLETDSLASGEEADIEGDNLETPSPPEESPRLEREWNVLLLILEGIPGAYLRQVQERTGVDHDVVMERLSDAAEEFFVFPNLVSHNRQTLRGLYTMLTGDYSAFELTTPRAYHYMGIPSDERPGALPQLLTAGGYGTVYLQAAPLGYMSKDQVMEAVGYERIIGKEQFRKQYVEFGWGPDDRAFLEESAAMVDRLEAEDRPWFLTLLTVGTHHPYAVPEEFAREYPNKKIAAVHYLDEALGEFLEHLRSSGRFEDTLLLVISDESHGLEGHPFGRFWPLGMIRVPGREGQLREERYGLVDLPETVLRILEAEEGSVEMIRRENMLGEAESPRRRPLLFERFASPEDGVIYELLQGGDVREYRPSSGKLFAPTYETTVHSGEEGARLRRRIEEWREEELSRLPEEGARREILLIRNGSYALPPGEPETLSTGQYLDIPGETSAEITLSVEAAAGAGPVAFSLQLLREGAEMELPDLDIPTLSPGEELEFEYSFENEKPTDRFWMVLTAEHLGEEEEASITVRRFSLELLPEAEE
ncbi:MAG: LTA synthase family protein [Spirochaetaceae bacterium]